MSWEEVSIGDYCQILSSKRIFASDYVNNGVPFYRSKEIIHKALNEFEGDEVFIKEERFKEIKDKFGAPEKGDVLISAVGNRSGICYWVKDEYDFYFKDGNLIWFRNFTESLLSKHLVYLLNSDIGQAKINNIFIGAAQKALTIEAVKKIKILLPPLETQKRIASILSTYDDLIENNLKRIKLLEETAQNIYKEWFVNFRFPNYEHTEFDAESGLPLGWENTTLGKVCLLISSGGTPSRNNPNFWNDKDYAWIKTKELQDNFVFDVEEYISKNALENSSAKLFEAGTIIMAIYASPTLGRLGILTRESCFNQASVGFKINEDKISNHFLYYKLIEERKNLNNKAIGAAQQNINVQKVKDHEILLPSKNLIDLFTLNVNDIFTQKRVLGEQNQKLKEARDILLPRLMNRTIEV